MAQIIFKVRLAVDILLNSGVAVKIALPRWQEGVRGRGAVLGCVVWANLRVHASEIFRFFHLWCKKQSVTGTHSYCDG